MAFHEHESLSTCVTRAKDSYADNERGSPSLIFTGLDSKSSSASQKQNTHVWVQDATRQGVQDVTVQKIFGFLLSAHIAK
ncbi:MAG: hypothetical protein Q9175_004183 [Cornicularia normoerica]